MKNKKTQNKNQNEEKDYIRAKDNDVKIAIKKSNDKHSKMFKKLADHQVIGLCQINKFTFQIQDIFT